MEARSADSLESCDGTCEGKHSFEAESVASYEQSRTIAPRIDCDCAMGAVDILQSGVR